MRNLRRNVVGFSLLLAVLCGFSVGAPAEKKIGPDPKIWEKTVDKAVACLKSRQAEDGTWSKSSSPAITGIVLIGLFRSGKTAADDPVAIRGLKFLETLVDSKDGHLAGIGSRVGLHNYATSVNLMAFRASGQEKYSTVVANATAYLKKLQWDEGEGKKPEDSVYGGAGYGGGSRPDLSNTHFFLDALVAAGTPKTDAVFKKALVYVSRCQNLKGEHNDQPWAGKINDGSFIYGAGPAGETRGAPGEDGARPGYGSMTYAGLKGLALCGVARDDPRYRKALEWIGKHYTVDANPGMPAGSGGRGLYYYLMTMAKCLDAVGLDAVTDADGKTHDWRADITAALVNRQRKDGGWINETDRWMEGNLDLCTAYALIALSHCKPKTK